MALQIVIRSRDNEPLYSTEQAAVMARVETAFLMACETYGLLTPQKIAGSIRRYTPADIRRAALIYRLQQQLDLDLDSLGVVLHLRSQLIDLQQEMDVMERQWRQKERKMQAEIHRLRRMLARMINHEVIE